MSSLVADTVIRCTYNEFWSFLRDVALLLPWWFWASMTGFMGDPDKRLYFGMLAQSGFVGLLFSTAMRDVVLQLPPANPSCDNSSFGGFNITAFATTQFFTLELLHRMYLRVPPLSGAWIWLQVVAYVAFEWFVLVYTGQDTHWGFWLGGLSGVVLQLLFSAVFYGYLLPRFPLVVPTWLARYLYVPPIPARSFVPDGWRIL